MKQRKGRPKLPDSKQRTTSIQLTPDARQALAAVAASLGVSKGEIIRRAFAAYLATSQQKSA